MDQKQITGRLISRNWIINLIGGLPALLGVVTIPLLLHYLGIERVGILAITFTLLNYAGQLDLGLGRATTKYVAECLGRGDTEKLPGLFWTSLLTQMIFGLAVALPLLAITPFLVHKVLKISPAQISETRTVFLILASSWPVIIVSNSLRGMLEAGQHFATTNFIKIPANASMFLLPVLGIPLGIGLPGIVFSLVAARIASAVAFLFFCFKFYPALRHNIAFEGKLVRPLFIYGGWISVSSVIGPFLMYVDRFFIGAMLSMSAVGYYTAPYEITARISLIPASLLATVFPAFSTLHASESHARMEQLYSRSIKSILLVSGPLLLILAAFAPQILKIWLGGDYAAKSATTLQVLALGVLINCIGFVPFGLLQGLGRPDLTAKFHLLETPFYVLALLVLLPHYGLVGAAWASVLRISLDTTLLLFAVLKLKFVSPRVMIERPLKRTLMALVLPAVLLPLSWINTSFTAQLALSSLVLLVFATAVWAYVLDHNERNLLLSALTLRSRMARAK
jgi:O-antigen/teichoic acid export membrane protein